MSIIHFSLTPHIYAACFDNAIIILDSTNDKYLSFIDDAAQYFQFALSGSFQRNDDKKLIPVKGEFSNELNCDNEQLNDWIEHFIESNFIMESSQATRKGLAPLPLKSGGLCDYKWDYKPSWKPFKQASKIQIFKAFFELAKVHRTMKRNGVKGVLDAIDLLHNQARRPSVFAKATTVKSGDGSTSSPRAGFFKIPSYAKSLIKKSTARHTNRHQPTEQEINKLSAAIDAASLLYPKKTFCLAWASTFVLLALKNNWSCNLAIGIQTNPFYAHAWAQVAGDVIHDDPVIAQVLSVILKEPNI